MVMGFPINGPTSVFYNNKSVVTSTLVQKSTLGKNNLVICYHAVREAVAVPIHQIAHIDGKFNPADLLMKLLKAAIKKPYIERIFINNMDILGTGSETLYHSMR